jgi:hypothetical protein
MTSYTCVYWPVAAREPRRAGTARYAPPGSYTVAGEQASTNPSHLAALLSGDNAR